jgi:asparagine synthase (glutamine-hydrolysing)
MAVAEARHRLQAMLARIAYRGPDECTGAVGEGFAIGAARLSIVDLFTGTQPAISADGKLFVVFNGEIFNYRELRGSLAAKGHTFFSNSEVEVLLRLYQEYGIDFVRMLNGQFAVAIWDGAARTVHLFRDPFGIRPLFWWSAGGKFLFASEIKSLLANPEVPVALDHQALLQTVRFWTVVGERTMFSGIRQVPAGHVLSWTSGNAARLDRYWEWPFAGSVEPLRLASDAEYFEAFDDALAQSVRRQSMADVEVGAYVSGGIDSSVIVHHLDALDRARDLATFSVAFDDPDYDESVAQQAVVQHYRTNHREVRLGAREVADDFPAAVEHAETALFRSAPVPMYRLSREVRRAGLKVVMSGEGADEILLGYDLFREVQIRRFWARNPQSRCRGQLLRRVYDYLPQYKNPRYANLLLDFYRPTLRDTGDLHYAMAVRWTNGKALESCFSRPLQDLAAAYDPVAELDEWLPLRYREACDVERAQAIEAMTLLGNYLLSSQGDRMALANSVETRHPYLDLDFVRFAARLPRSLKLRGMKDKFILRETYADDIPKAIRRRKKFAYQAPEKRAFFEDGKLLGWAADLLSRDRIASDGVFDPAYVEQYCLAPPARDTGRQSFRGNMLFMIVLSTTLLIDRFVRSRAGPTPAAPPQLQLVDCHPRLEAINRC